MLTYTYSNVIIHLLLCYMTFIAIFDTLLARLHVKFHITGFYMLFHDIILAEFVILFYINKALEAMCRICYIVSSRKLHFYNIFIIILLMTRKISLSSKMFVAQQIFLKIKKGFYLIPFLRIFF